MTQTRTSSPPVSAVRRSRLPHVVGVLAVVALIAGGVLLWTGRFATQAPSDRSAFGATPASAGAARTPLVPMPAELPGLARRPLVHTAPHASPANGKRLAAAPLERPPAVAATGSERPEFTQAILGTWKQYSYGHRLLNVKENGKATIDVKLDGFSAIAFGEKLHFEIDWSIDGDTLVFKTTGGTPEGSVKAVKSLYGDNRIYRILDVNEKQMLLEEGDEKKTPWDRVVEE